MLFKVKRPKQQHPYLLCIGSGQRMQPYGVFPTVKDFLRCYWSMLDDRNHSGGVSWVYSLSQTPAIIVGCLSASKITGKNVEKITYHKKSFYVRWENNN